MMDTRHLPIRVRLALWYLASFFVVLVLFVAGTFYAMQAGIQKDSDRDLTARLAGIESFLIEQSQESNEHLQHELGEQAALRAGGELLQINDEYGRWIFQSPSIRHLGIHMPVNGPIGRPVFESMSPSGVPVRVITAFRSVRGRKYGIQLGQSLEESSELVQHFGWILLAAIPIALLIASATGYWMARRALQPVIAITEDARAINALDISNRIALPLANDELRSLSVTLNEMMGRLESAFRRITQFTADAAHELRTPIALIRTTAELAVSDSSRRALQDAVSSILEESERTTDLLEDLLVLARADSHVRLRVEEIDLAVQARRALKQMEVLASSKGLSLHFIGDNRPFLIHGDLALIRRLFLILTDNAVKYTPLEGQVSLRIRAIDLSIRVEIEDTGAGIPPEDLPHIFERFYRADKARDRSGGAGLGLSIAEWIVKSHGAEIFVSSVVDQGTTVTLCFPDKRFDITET
jgi:heavy metal sensor kinase